MKQKHYLMALLLTLTACSRGVYAADPYVGASLGVGGHQYQPGASANLFAGYGGKLNNDIYVGAEANAELGHYRGLGNTYGIGASLMPGLMITNNTMLFGRIGEEFTMATHSNDSVTFGTVYGAGLQNKLNKNWDIRGEYKYTNSKGGDSSYNLGLVYNLGD